MKKTTHSKEFKDAVLKNYLFTFRVSYAYYSSEFQPSSLTFEFQVEDMSKEGLCLLYGQPSLVPIIVTIKELLYVLHALFTSILTSPLNSPLIVVENYTQQHVHQEKHAKDDK